MKSPVRGNKSVAGTAKASFSANAARTKSSSAIERLQQSVGNRAVGDMIQTKKQRFKPKEEKKELENLDKMGSNLDRLTMEAHEKALKALKTGNLGLVKDEGVTEGHYTNWILHRNAMTTGYIIEDMVTSNVSEGDGYSAQETRENARPDFVITDGAYEGVVDVTSSKEAGHVLQKDFSLAPFAYVAEAIYPSIDFSDISASDVTFSAEDEELIKDARIRRARETFANQVGNLKKQLDLIANQSMLNKGASEKAAVARELLSKVKNSENKSEVQAVDQALAEVRVENAKSFFTKGYVLDSLADIIAFVKERYFLD